MAWIASVHLRLRLLSPNPPVQFLNPFLVRHEPRFAAICATFLHWDVALLSFPQADVGIVGAFGGLGVDIAWIFDEAAAIGTHITELTILADVNLVLADEPQVFEPRFLDGLLQCDVADVAIAFRHSRTVLNLSVGINANFAVETGVVVLGFGEEGEIDGEGCITMKIPTATGYFHRLFRFTLMNIMAGYVYMCDLSTTVLETPPRIDAFSLFIISICHVNTNGFKRTFL